MAASLFAANGYSATGMAELAETAQLGKGALYYYIGSKENLLVAIQDRVLAPLLDSAGTIARLDARPVVRLCLLSEALLEVILSRIDHIWVYEHDYRHLTGDNLERVLEQRHDFERLVQGLIESAVEDGTLRQVDPRLATLEFLNLHNHTYQWAQIANRRWGALTLSREYCRTLLVGMGASGETFEHIEAELDSMRQERNTDASG